MKKFNKKSLALLIAAALLLTFTVSGTVAYLAASTDPVENVFTPAEVDTTLDETITNNAKTSIKVNNTQSNIDVYVRVALIANWVDENGNIMAPAAVPEFTLNSAWFKGGDGYYYHKAPVAAGMSSSNLVNDSTGILLTKQESTGYVMQIVVIHQSIQAEPETTVETVWKVTVTDDNIVSQP